MEYVILVDSNDSPIGISEKMAAHEKGQLHRALSVFVFNKKGQLMLQKRDSKKYHAGGLWSNTCCSHPRSGEDTLAAAHRRLIEEMGFDCQISKAFTFIYNVKLDHGMTEHEFDHVFVGNFEGTPTLNREEAEEWKWIDMEKLKLDIASQPEKYAEWFKVLMKPMAEFLEKQNVGFHNNEHKEKIEAELKKFLPEQATQHWASAMILSQAESAESHDTEALTQAIIEPAWNILSGGGKRIRPLLMMLCCEAVGGRAEDAAPFTPIPEIIHNGSLVADDIEDNSAFRRGRPAIHAAFGTDVAINLSSTMMSLPMAIIRDSKLSAEIKSKAYSILSTNLLKCHMGQAADIYWHTGKSSKIPSEAQYVQMCSDKAGALISMAAQLGALIGGATEEQINALGSFAEKAGVAFQIQDDMLDFESPGEKKEYAEDIREGKRTLLAIHALNNSTEEEKKRLLYILNLKTKDEGLLREAVSIIKQQGSIKHAQDTMNRLIEDAWKEIDSVLPESQAKEKLLQFSKLLVNRTL